MYCFERGGGIYNTQEINNEGYAVLEVHQVGGGEADQSEAFYIYDCSATKEVHGR